MSQSYYESPLKESNSKNGAPPVSLQSSFFEEIKQKLFPHEKALLLKKGALDSSLVKTTSEGELMESSYFVSTPGKEIKDLLKRFSSLDCSAHKIRQYDHICQLVNCGQAKALFCSQCLLENEDHTKAHKNDIIPMENYLSAKTDNLSGERQCKRVRLMMKDLVQMKENLDDQQNKLKARIEQDLNEIESTVRSYCSVLKQNLFSKIRKHADSKSQELKELLTQLQEQEQVLFKQQADILQDFKSTLTQNFDFSNTEQVNTFVKKLRSKTNLFSIDTVIQYCDDQIDDLHEQEAHDKLSAYCSEQVEQTKKDLSKAFEQPLNNSSFINFCVSNSTKTSSSNAEVSLDDKRLNVEQDKIYTGKEKKIKYSLQQEITSLTTHKSPINSIAVIDPFTFACVSNDSKLKIWGVTPANLVLHEKASLDLADLCLNIKYSSQRKQLLCALSKGTIEQYEILPESQTPKLIRKYEGHERTARAISIVESLNGFVSISYDETLKFWEWERSAPVATESYKMDIRVMDSNELYVLLGSCKDSALLAYEIQRTSGNHFKGFLGMSNIKGIPITHKITCISLFPKDSPLALCGSNSGTQWLVNVKTQQCLQKYEIHKDRVFSIIPITISQTDDSSKVQAFMSASWDGKICVCDSESGQIVSSCKYGLSNDSKKHWNTDGVKGIMSEFKEAQKDDSGFLSGGTYDFRLFSIGNDDRNIQVLKLTLSNY